MPQLLETFYPHIHTRSCLSPLLGDKILMSLVAPRDMYMSSLIWVVHILISAQIRADPLSLLTEMGPYQPVGDTGALSFIIRRKDQHGDEYINNICCVCGCRNTYLCGGHQR